MLQQKNDTEPVFLTTKEVADLLRVKERKVYDLAAEGEIPHRRITGKLLFPRAEILAWLQGEHAEPVLRPAVLTGSHDPLLEWAVRESGSGLAMLFDGSSSGLESFVEGTAALAGLHIPDEAPSSDAWNIAAVQALGMRDCVLIGWAERSRGLLVPEGVEAGVKGLDDLRGKRLAGRQPGAGAAKLFERLMTESGLTQSDFVWPDTPARTESDAAAAVATGEADAALGIAAMARQYHLGFVPLLSECFDVLIDRTSYFTPPVQTLLNFASQAAFRDKATSLGGYDLGPLGQVRWLSP